MSAEIRKRNLGTAVIQDINERFMSIAQVAEKHDLTDTEVQTFLRENKLRMYDDEKLEAIAMSEEFNPLGVIQHYFQSVHHSSKELAMTGIVAQMLREKIARVLSEEGIEGLDANPKLVKQWHDNANKLNRLVDLAPKLLTSYIELFSQVLDVQREVSYVKLITDILRKEDPELYKKIQRALDADPAAKRVLEALSRDDVLMYWDSETGQVVRSALDDINEENG